MQLPTVGPDGRPMGYRLDSKALGRELGEDETLVKAKIPENDRLILTADITAGAITTDQSPRMRRLWADYQLMQDLAARSDLIEFTAKAVRTGLPPETYIVTYHCKGIYRGRPAGTPKIWRPPPGGDLPAQPVPAALAGDEMADPHLAPQHQPPERHRLHRRSLVDRQPLARPAGDHDRRDGAVQELPRRSDQTALSLGSRKRRAGAGPIAQEHPDVFPG